MKKNILFLSIVFLGLNFILASFVYGFGVTPPYVNNQVLTPGSHFESTVYLSQGEPLSDAMAEVTIDAPEIEKWITIKQGKNFIMPKGERLVPMTVVINVPSDAAYKNYLGYIRVRFLPTERKEGEGQISIVGGARIDLSLTVTEKGFPDFKIKGIKVPTFEETGPFVFLMILDNTGNVKIRPSRVAVDIYDLDHKEIIASGEVTEMDFVEPFQTRQIQGSFPVSLPVGEYWADITTYKEGVQLGDVFKVFFEVVPEGTLKKQEIEKEGLNRSDYVLGIITILIVVMILIWINRDKIKNGFRKK